MTAQSAQAGIATSDPRATDVGAEVLRSGGNCVDAAVAAVLALFVLEPHHCGPGGDAYLLVHRPGADEPEALDGAGAVPARLTPAALAADGLRAVAPFGPRSVTVPGAVGMLDETVRRWGSRSLADLAKPAVSFARGGFEVRPSLAAACASSASRLAGDPVLSALYLPDTRPLPAGARVVNPALAEFLEQLAADGSDPMYRGAVAGEIADCVADGGGYLTRQDLAAHRTDPMAPLEVSFAGARVWQLPAPTQGPAVIHALASLDISDGNCSRPELWAAVCQAITEGLLTVGVDLVAAPWLARQGGTSHVAVVDGDGGVASMITSVFAPFGSAVGIASLGSALQNRAAGFLLLGEPPRPGKPPHTIIPGLVTRDGRPEAAVGVAGGLMQAQGQIQLLVRMLAGGESATSAVDAPRLRVLPRGELALEPHHPLAELHPDAVGRPPGDGGFGCGQIARNHGGVVTAAGDGRRDGGSAVVPVGAGAP